MFGLFPDTLEVASCQGLNLKANVTVRWFYICWVPCCGLLLNTLLKMKGRIKIKVLQTCVIKKNMECMFGGLFLLNIVKKKNTFQRSSWSPNVIPSARRLLVLFFCFFNHFWI